jgi:hypothetical protein
MTKHDASPLCKRDGSLPSGQSNPPIVNEGMDHLVNTGVKLAAFLFPDPYLFVYLSRDVQRTKESTYQVELVDAGKIRDHRGVSDDAHGWV